MENKENGAKPKLKDFTPINHNILNKILKTRLSECQLKILLLIFRKTAGDQQKLYCNLSYSYIEKYIPFSRRAIIYAVQDLERRNIIINYKEPGGKINKFGVNGKISMWDSATHCTQEIKERSQGSATHCTQEIKEDILTFPSATHCTIDSATHCTIDSATHCTQEKKYIKKSILKKEEQNNPFEDFILDENIIFSKSKKTINEKLLKEDFYKQYPKANYDDYLIFSINLQKKGYKLKN